ncbi:MAG: hypothetical protein V4658_10740 [Bacteroidota bacterium]
MKAGQIRDNSVFYLKEAWSSLLQNRTGMFVLLLVFGLNIHFLFSHSRLSTSPLSRYKTVECLLEHHTFEINKSSFPASIDAISVNGRFYSDKPPLYSVIMALEAAPMYYLFDVKPSVHALFYEKYFLLINQVMPFYLMLVLAFHFMLLLGFSSTFAALGIVALSICNLTMAYTVSLINHTPTAVFCFLGFYLIALAELKDTDSFSRKHFFITGLLFGLAVSYEIYALGLFACMAAYLLLKYKKFGHVALLCAGALIPILLGLAINILITGTPLPFYFVKAYFLYENSYWQNPVGFDALNDGYLKYFFNITLGHHGVFAITPLLLFVFLPVTCTPMKRLYNWCKIAGVLTLILMVIFTNNYGGYAIGFRFCIFLFPVMIFYCVHAAYRYRMNKMVLVTFLFLMCCSAFSVWEGLQKDPLIRGSIDQFLLKDIQ